MPYLAAVLKVWSFTFRYIRLYECIVYQESMRFQPAVYQNYRMAAHDTVLPLSKPITTTTGETISSLPIGKGTKLVLSIAAYNRYFPHLL